MVEPTTRPSIPARYFDGRRSLSTPVDLQIADGRARVTGPNLSRDEPLGAVVISDEIGNTPRLVQFSDGSFCEITDTAGLRSLLEQQGLARERLPHWERSRPLVFVSVLSLAGLMVAGYLVGLPWMARTSADRMPPAALESLSRHALSTLDRTVLSASQLSEGRQHALALRFARLAQCGWRTSRARAEMERGRVLEIRSRDHRCEAPSHLRVPPRPEAPVRVRFRRSQALGANAFALPSGVIVVTDDLTRLARSDDEVMAVLAHEAGHVAGRHGLRNIIQSSAVSILLTWYIGDVSALAASAPAALLEARYSRDLEREADAYAADFLAASGLSAQLLADILQRMSSEGRRSGEAGGLVYLSTHPTTAERLRTLRATDRARSPTR
jgi:Zn-dependent protease with chaperone function